MNVKGGWKNNAHEHCTNYGSNKLNSELKQQSMVVFFTKMVVLVNVSNQLFTLNQDDFLENERYFLHNTPIYNNLSQFLSRFCRLRESKSYSERKFPYF